MPDIFEAEDQPARDRRMTEEDAEQPSTVVTQTLSPQEDKPEIRSATPLHPERHVGPNHMHIFSSFCEKPENVTFETQEDGEEILLLLRKSLITNIPWLLLSLLLALVPPILFFITPAKELIDLLPPSYVFVLIALYYLSIAAYVLISFITWYFNTALITDKRIVDIDFSDLVYKNIAETKMDLVQDVSQTEAGAIRTMFNYGDVLVQTAGSLDNFDLHAVPHPDRAVEVIESLIGKGRGIGV